MSLQAVYERLRTASGKLAQLDSALKNNALAAVCAALDAGRNRILCENEKDVTDARSGGMRESMIDRLKLSEARIDGMIASLQTVIRSEDPTGICVSGWKTPEGLFIRQLRVPIGVAAIIYESRPNVTVEAFSLAYKSGNSVLLRGSSAARYSNAALIEIIQNALRSLGEDRGGIPDALAFSCSKDRSDVEELFNAVGYIDVLLPRGGADLIKTVVEKSRVPVIETGSGVCHIFVDESADSEKAAAIAENAKLQRPGVCNAMETLLVHSAAAEAFLPLLLLRLDGRAELRCCPRSLSILETAVSSLASAAKEGVARQGAAATVLKPATEADFGFEFLDYILAVKVVDSVKEAIAHINAHNTKHSDSILTNNLENARRFQNEVDAACVYVNASTRFTDGGVFGFGAELGISTQKMHVRGPMGLSALTTVKYVIEGQGHIRES